MNSVSTNPAHTGGAPADNWLALDRQLCFALYGATLAMTKLYRPLLQPLGLTYPQYLVMLQLWQQDGLTVSALGDQLGLDSGTLTPLLKRLQAAGNVTRQRDAGDERRVLIALTAQGRALRAQAELIPHRVGAAIGCSLAEMGALRTQLQQIRQRLTTAANATAAGAVTHDELAHDDIQGGETRTSLASAADGPPSVP